MDKAPDAFRTISEVAEDLDVPQHVLRFWETRFPQVRPLKRGGGRRYYRPEDVDLLRGIRHLLYGQGYTIRGVQRLFKEEGVRFVAGCWRPGAPALRRGAETGAAADAAGSPDSGPEPEGPFRHLVAAVTDTVGAALEPGRRSAPEAGPDAEDAGRAVPASAGIDALRTAIAGRAEAPNPAGDGMAAPGLSEAAARRLRAVLSELLEIKRILDGA